MLNQIPDVQKDAPSTADEESSGSEKKEVPHQMSVPPDKNCNISDVVTRSGRVVRKPERYQ
jgi:hypothetical protein